VVKPPAFGYFRPESVGEALALLGSLGPDAKVLAGGQSLIPLLNLRLATPSALVDINRLAELGYVRVADGHVVVGALARHAAVLADPAAVAAQPLIGQALRQVAHPVIRNRGTTVGSIVHADPAGEMTAVLAVLGGSVRVASAAGERLIPAASFFLGPLESDTQPDELAIEAIFPVLPARAGCGFAELSRRNGDFAICGVAAIVTLDEAGQVSQARAAYLSVAGTPLVLDLTAACASDDLADAANLASTQIEPSSDIHATAAYRRHLAGVLTVRALTGALAHARGTAVV
jgi:carbon-monoxide dehydrogenase medium subunit